MKRCTVSHMHNATVSTRNASPQECIRYKKFMRKALQGFEFDINMLKTLEPKSDEEKKYLQHAELWVEKIGKILTKQRP